VGRRVNAAVAAITDADLVPDQVSEPTGDPAADGVVLEQSPPAGRKAKRGSAVTLTIGEYDPALDPDQQDTTTPPPEEDETPVPPTETIPDTTP
ncbi:MAG TPA: PASTA domain-containing protein, partial [Capillimicrobium sp.]|nr:PASTA domain-containing protein [Capillimicrobium sp.]